jgi:hypothetical protein
MGRKHLYLSLGLGASSVLAGCGRTGMVAPAGDSSPIAADAAPGSDRTPAGCAPAPVAACPPGPSVPASLGRLDDAGSVFDIAVHGDRLLAGMLVEAPIEERPRGRIATIAVPSGARGSREVPDGIPVHLQVAGGALIYQLEVAVPTTGAWRFDYDEVLRWDLTTDALAVLEPPAGYVNESYPMVASNASGQVFWNVVGQQESALAMWDPCVGQTTVLVEDYQIDGVHADATTVFWDGRDAARHQTMSSMPIAGGPVQRIYVKQSPPGNSDRVWVGIDGESLYYIIVNDSAAGILAMPKAGGEGHTVVAGADPWVRPQIDDVHVYWADWSEQNALRRAPKTGGATEVLWSEPQRWIQDLAIDECNIYWAVANPFEIFYQAK